MRYHSLLTACQQDNRQCNTEDGVFDNRGCEKSPQGGGGGGGLVRLTM